MSLWLDDLDDGTVGMCDWLCDCGVVDDLDEAGRCHVCAAAPHDRECSCEQCGAYWTRIAGGAR